MEDDAPRGGGEGGGAAGEKVKEFFDGGGTVLSELELFGEIEPAAVAMEGGDGEIDLVRGEEVRLDFGKGGGAEEFVDAFQFGFGEGGEFGEWFERAGAVAAALRAVSFGGGGIHSGRCRGHRGGGRGIKIRITIKSRRCAAHAAFGGGAMCLGGAEGGRAAGRLGDFDGGLCIHFGGWFGLMVLGC